MVFLNSGGYLLFGFFPLSPSSISWATQFRPQLHGLPLQHIDALTLQSDCLLFGQL